MKDYKRMTYGTQMVEWNDEEMIARRYEVVDNTEALVNKVASKLVEEKPIPAQMAEMFQDAWVHCGKVIVTK